MTTKVNIEDGRIYVKSHYAHRDICKSIPGRMWVPSKKIWTYPTTSTTAFNIKKAFKDNSKITTDAEFDLLIDAYSARCELLNNKELQKALRPVKSKTTPMDHQILGTRLVGLSDGSMLLWEMGTGKTKAVIDAICHYGIHLSLVVCPLNVIGQWEREIKKHANKPITVLALNMRKTAAKKADALNEAIEYMGKSEQLVVLINYEAAWRPPLGPTYKQLGGKRRILISKGHFLAHRWGLIICDEIHRIKDPKGRASTFMGQLANRALHRVGLTGTPMPRDPLDLWAQMRFVDAGVFGTSYGRYKATYAILGGFEGKQVIAFKDLPLLHKKLYSVAHRVTKKEVLDLPAETDVERTIILSPKAWKAYVRMEQELVVEVAAGHIDVSNALVELLRLQQCTSGYLSIETGRDENGKAIRKEETIDTSKRDALAEILTDLPDNEPMVVFCRFLHDLRAIEEICNDLDSPREHYEISGARKQRDEWADACDRGKGAVVGVQIRAGGLGVDLTQAAFAVFYSIGFEWGDFEQAKARLHRHGQDRPVTYLHLIAANTADEDVYSAMVRKEKVVLAVLDRLGYDRKPNEKA